MRAVSPFGPLLTGLSQYHVPKRVHIDFEDFSPDPFGGDQHEEDDDDDDDEDEDDEEGDEALDELFVVAGPDSDFEITGTVAPGHGYGFQEDGLAVDDFPDIIGNPFVDAGNDEDFGPAALEDLDVEVDDDGLESSSTESDPGSIETETDGQPRPPQISWWRLNLTSLSHHHNLYFAAYRDQIHISRPRSCVSHSLPPTPDLVLRPRQSPAAMRVGGTIDRVFPHQVNHLIVADFGEEEILLMAYDDGDVIGYFTRHIEQEISHKEQTWPARHSTGHVRPFFHENVDISAWGLAVHKKSRLIAVGSNAHAVTLFIPALTGPEVSFTKNDPNQFWRTRQHPGPGNITIATEADYVDLSSLSQRDANWKITLDTAPIGDNIPNLTFSSDKDGKAEKVVAVDVAGNIWLMDIWNPYINYEKIPAIHRARPGSLPGTRGRPRGWGVLVLHEDSFLPTQDFKDALGLTKEDARFARHLSIGRWVDISRGHRSMLDNPTQPSSRRPQVQSQRQDVVHQDLVEREYWFRPYNDGSSELPRRRRDPEVEHVGTTLSDGSSILRLYEADIELRSHEEDGLNVMWQHAVKQLQYPAPHLPAGGWLQERLSNNHHVPELSLVVAGSMCGRVALITLTRPMDKLMGLERGFKIEAILPTREDEDAWLRPCCPLYGVAVGPLPIAAGKPDRISPARPRRFRLMLQYYDHRILSYEISRGPESDSLMVI
ncbi:hypothetical protein JX266_008298 [Neoarthrinium moseri]|nr:hypothetical protein JX266_008298 [Neoarthrinium moseri]